MTGGLATITEEGHRKYAKGLTTEEKMLVTLRDELYAAKEKRKSDTHLARWDRMIADLGDRLKTRPYIHKLVNRIKTDLEKIETLQKYERENGVNLANYLPKQEEPATE